MTCAEGLGDRLKFVSSSDVILCGWLDTKHQLTNLQYQNRVKDEVSGISGCLKASSEKKTTRNSV